MLRCGSQAREQLREAQENDSSDLERSYNTNVFPKPQADNLPYMKQILKSFACCIGFRICFKDVLKQVLDAVETIITNSMLVHEEFATNGEHENISKYIHI